MAPRTARPRDDPTPRPLSLVHSRGSLAVLRTSVVAAAAPVLTFTEKLVAGSMARGFAQTVLHPVDVVRTRLQAKGVVRNWSPGVFLKGILPQMILAVPAGGIQFVTIEFAREKLAALDKDSKYQSLRDLTAGACGAIAAASCRVPQEAVKQKIQADIYPNMAVAVSEIYKSGGIAAFYNGTIVTMSRDVPWNALTFLFHAKAKRIFKQTTSRAPDNSENLALAGISGALAAVIMTPVDVVKTRIMTRKLGMASISIGATLQKIIAEEGAMTLFKGVIPRVVFLAPLAGITFSVYEAIGKVLVRRRQRALALRPVAVGPKRLPRLRMA